MYYDLEHTRVESTFTAELELLVVVAARGVCLRSKGDSPLLCAHSFFFPSAKKRRRGRRSRAEHKMELAHARSIRGVSACSDPRLVYKTLVVGIMPSSGKCPPHRGVHRKRTTFPMKCRERKCSCGQHYKVTKNVTKFLSLVEFSTRARLAEWLRRSPAKIVLQLEFSRVSHFRKK